MAYMFILLSFYLLKMLQLIHIKTELLIQNLKIQNLKILTSVYLKPTFSWLYIFLKAWECLPHLSILKFILSPSFASDNMLIESDLVVRVNLD